MLSCLLVGDNVEQFFHLFMPQMDHLLKAHNTYKIIIRIKWDKCKAFSKMSDIQAQNELTDESLN